MTKILANDGISQTAIKILGKVGFQVITTKVDQEKLVNYINENNIDVLLVRSATKVRKDIIDSCNSLKIIGRGGVGMDNIDVDYAKEKGLKVINTPAASSDSVGELVFSHLFCGVRFLYDSNRQLPLSGETKFSDLKKSYAKGRELRGKTLGIVGIGRIGQSTAKIALGLGMKVLFFDKFVDDVSLQLSFFDGHKVSINLKGVTMESLLEQSDFISLHVPAQKEYIIGKKELNLMKHGAGLVNAARGGVVDEQALVEALDNGKLAFAGLDVFENEPTPSLKLLMHPKVSLTPHIGAATLEAQDRIGVELAEQIVQILEV